MARFQFPPNASTSSSSSSQATSSSSSTDTVSRSNTTHQQRQQLVDSDSESYNTAEEQLPSPTRFSLRTSEYHRQPRRTLPGNQRPHPFARQPSPEEDNNIDTDTESTESPVHNSYDHSDRNTKHEDSDDFAVGLGSTGDKEDRDTNTATGDSPVRNQPTQTAQLQRNPRKYRSTTIKIATHNIRDARNTRLQQACLNLAQQNIDIAILTEMRIPSSAPIHTRQYAGYSIFSTYTERKNQGGIAIAYKTKAKNWHIESEKRHRPCVVSCLLVSATRHTPLIGAYLPPGEQVDLEYLTKALERFPNQQPLILGDLNTDLEDPTRPRSIETNNLLSTYGLIDMIAQFQQRRRHRDRTTWFQRKQDTMITARCDYILGSNRRLFKAVRICTPRHFTHGITLQLIER
jgi:exonuclease III